MRWLVLVSMSLLIFGCSPAKVEHAATAEAEKEPEKVVTRDEAIKSLPCFQCHAYEKFSAPPRKGVFSHRLHLDSGYHCNQCHDFQGHQHITVRRDVCGNCHSIKAIAFNKTAFPSRFNHESHAKTFSCRECHPGVFLMKTGAAEVTMKDIYNGAYCGACHDGKKAFSANECDKCHAVKGFNKELTYKVEGIGDVAFSHKFHTSAFGCSDCHPKLFEMKKTQGRMKMEPMEKGKLCGACHNNQIAFPVSDCARCHKS
ncbi:MAG: c(7)-type cytochrome triheme domain-containing protein [Nitrospirota bacterium]